MTETTPPIPSAQPTTPPPEPPRALTPRGNRRAWVEPRVRVWWTSALLLAIIGAYFVINQVRSSSRDRQLISTGMKVRATVTAINDQARRDRVVSTSEIADFNLSFKTSAGAELRINRARLIDPRDASGSPLKTLKVGSEITVYVDPNRFVDWNEKDTRLWTDRPEAPLREDLLLGLIILPFVNILLIIAVIHRIRVIRVWRRGQVMAAVVVDTRQTASAPFSRAVRFALRDLRDRRILRAVVPVRVTQFKP